MAIAQLEYPRFKAINASNKALSGGKVYVYEAGTSTKATIWQDADKNSQHSNPVTLDTNGEAEIWFEGPVKVVLEDSDGNQQWTMDDIESDIPPTDVGRFNQVENGSFEIDSDADNLPDEWTITEYNSSTSTVELDTSEVAHGANSLKFVSQGDGGGTATTTDFFPVNAGQIVTVAFTIKSSVADVQNSVSVRWHDKDQTFISSSTVYNDATTNPTSFTEKRFTASAPSTATYAKLRLVGCDSADSTSGTTYYDDVKVYTDEQASVHSNSDVWEFTGTGGSVSASASDINNVTGIITTQGDLMLGDSNGDESRLAIGSSNRVLRSNGTTASWSQVKAGDIATDAVTDTQIADNSVGANEIKTDSVAQGNIANNAVAQGEIKTTSGTVSVTASSTASASARRSLPGGNYGFYPRSSFSASGSTDTGFIQIVGESSEFSSADSIGENTYICLRVENSNSNADATVTAKQTYFQSSPPYDLGDSYCGLFVEIDLLSNGNIGGIYLAPDPVWANNGPTDIRPDYTDKKTGKKYKRVKRPQVTRADVDAGRADLADLIAARKEAPVEDVEITPEFKNADMDLLPHSWVSPPQGTICMLDPVQTHDLLMLHEEGEDIADLLHKGFILPGDGVPRYGPPGVKMISFKWKNTKK